MEIYVRGSTNTRGTLTCAVYGFGYRGLFRECNTAWVNLKRKLDASYQVYSQILLYLHI